jgi:hypothetical protein
MKPSAHRPDVRAGGLVSVLRLLRQPRPRLRRVAELDQVERHVRALPRLPAGRESWSGLRTPGFSGSERGGTANSNLARTTTRRGRLTRSTPSAGGPPRQKGWSRTKTTRNGRACTTWASWVPRPALAEPSGHLEPDRVTTARSPRSRRGRRPGVEGGRPRSPRSQHVARAHAYTESLRTRGAKVCPNHGGVGATVGHVEQDCAHVPGEGALQPVDVSTSEPNGSRRASGAEQDAAGSQALTNSLYAALRSGKYARHPVSKGQARCARCVPTRPPSRSLRPAAVDRRRRSGVRS